MVQPSASCRVLAVLACTYIQVNFDRESLGGELRLAGRVHEKTATCDEGAGSLEARFRFGYGRDAPSKR